MRVVRRTFRKIKRLWHGDAFIPITRVILISAWGGRTKQIRKQVLVPSSLCNDVV